jgi:hypothetical protein
MTLAAEIQRVLDANKHRETPLADLIDWLDKWSPRASYQELSSALAVINHKLEQEDA